MALSGFDETLFILQAPVDMGDISPAVFIQTRAENSALPSFEQNAADRFARYA
jgi:hypothetical protein